MKVEAPNLLPILRSEAQARILGILFAHPDEGFTTTRLAQRADTSLPTALREVNRLAAADIVTRTPVGRAQLITVNQEHPLYLPLSQIVLRTFGAAPAIAAAYAEVQGVQQAFIYGSWAARLAGHPGGPPHDIDVLLIGTTPRALIYQVAEVLTGQLKVDINVRQVPEQAWAADDDSFLTSLRTQPLYDLATRRLLDTASAA